MSGTVWILHGAPRRKGEASRGKRELDGHVFAGDAKRSAREEAEAWLSQKYVQGEYYATEHTRLMRRECTCGRPSFPAGGKATGVVLDPFNAMSPQAKRRRRERGEP